MMYDHEKSDPAIVAVKPTNKAGHMRDRSRQLTIYAALPDMMADVGRT